MSPLTILHDNESKFSKWALNSYSVSFRHFSNLPLDVFTQLNIFLFIDDLQAWSEYSKRKLDERLYGSHYKIGDEAGESQQRLHLSRVGGLHI